MPDETKATKARHRFNQLESIRLDYESLRQDITDLVATRRSNVSGSEVPGKKKGLEIYDGTPRSACQQHADGLFGYLCSPSMEWNRFFIARKEINAIPEVKKYLQEANEQAFYAFNRSNFYAVAPEYFFDGCSIGTAAMYAEEDIGAERIINKVIDPNEVYISPNRYGEIDVLFRKYKMTARSAFDEFGDKLSDKIKAAAKNAPETEFEFLHGTYPNTDRQLGKADSNNKAFSSIYLEATGTNDLLSEKGYDLFPYSVWRYRVGSGEVYGRSPAADAIVEIFGLNQVTKTMLQASQLAVEPAYNVPKEMRGKVRIKPRGMNYYEDPQRQITPVHIPSNLPAGETQQDRLQNSIERNFHIEFFMLLSRAALEGRQLTVPQVMEMQGEKGAMLGAVVGRLNGDFFDSEINRYFQIESDAGRMPPVPDVLYETGETNIEVEYLGPLAQAQKQLLKSQAITRSIETLAPMVELKPEIMDRINFDVVTDKILDSNNFPQDAIISIEDANEIRQQRQEQMQAMQTAEMLKEGAKVVPGLGKEIEKGSVLDKVGGE
jgi:hypothetical protein